MSHKQYPPPGTTTQRSAFDPKNRERVTNLIAQNNSHQALNVAKEIHKQCHSVASEELLLDAYHARFRALLETNLDREAQQLLDLVQQRYPSSSARVAEWRALLAARQGDLGALLAPLSDPNLTAEKQAALAAQIRRSVLDLHALAECQTLAAEHPLRLSAAALAEAFSSVTSGPVSEDALLLPEVSRSSPLAPWKMIIRAIAAYYRRDDALCEKYLALVQPDSAAAHLIAPLRKMLSHPQNLRPAANELVNQVSGDLALVHCLHCLDSAFKSRPHQSILSEIHNAAVLCRQIDPALLERLQQHIAVRARSVNVDPNKVASALGGPSLKNAYFWRLLARAEEEVKGSLAALLSAGSFWEEFRKHAIREGWFPAKGPQVAALYLRMADMLRRVDGEELEEATWAFAQRFDGHADYYRNQPPEIRALMPDRRELDLTFLKPLWLLRRASEADPTAETFQSWLNLAEESCDEESPVTPDQIAERWAAALPNDIPPLLYLMQSAEKRDALVKAFKFMERAESIDALNADVRRARLRLLVAMAVRHIREKKAKLAVKELLQIRELPQSKQGDRPAFVAALHSAWHLLRNEKLEASGLLKEAATLLGDDFTARLLFAEVERWCGLPAIAQISPKLSGSLTAALGRVCAIAEDMDMPMDLTPVTASDLIAELTAQKISAEPRALLALGEVAMRQDLGPLGYLLSGVGLTQGTENHARFLFLRGRSIPPLEEDRELDCLAAASELARRQHDNDLLKRISEWRQQTFDPYDIPSQAQAARDSSQIAAIIKREIELRDVPNEPDDAEGDLDHGECNCPSCRAQKNFGLPNELIDLLQKYGPEAVAKMLMEGNLPGKKKPAKGGRGNRVENLDLPF